MSVLLFYRCTALDADFCRGGRFLVEEIATAFDDPFAVDLAYVVGVVVLHVPGVAAFGQVPTVKDGVGFLVGEEYLDLGGIHGEHDKGGGRCLWVIYRLKPYAFLEYPDAILKYRGPRVAG